MRKVFIKLSITTHNERQECCISGVKRVWMSEVWVVEVMENNTKAT